MRLVPMKYSQQSFEIFEKHFEEVGVDTGLKLGTLSEQIAS